MPPMAAREVSPLAWERLAKQGGARYRKYRGRDDRAAPHDMHDIEIEGSLGQRALRSLKHSDAFAFFDNYGDIGVIGMDLRHEANAMSIRDLAMPAFLNYVTLNQLSLGKSRLDLRLDRHGRDVTLNLLRRQSDAKVMLIK